MPVAHLVLYWPIFRGTLELELRSNLRICLMRVRGPGSSVGIATELRAGRSGDRIPVGGEIFLTCPDRPWGPPSLLYNGYRVFTEGKERPGRDTDPSTPSSAVVKKG